MNSFDPDRIENFSNLIKANVRWKRFKTSEAFQDTDVIFNKEEDISEAY